MNKFKVDANRMITVEIAGCSSSQPVLPLPSHEAHASDQLMAAETSIAETVIGDSAETAAENDELASATSADPISSQNMGEQMAEANEPAKRVSIFKQRYAKKRGRIGQRAAASGSLSEFSKLSEPVPMDKSALITEALIIDLYSAMLAADLVGFVDSLEKHLKADDDRQLDLSDTLITLLDSVAHEVPAKRLNTWMWCLKRLGLDTASSQHKAIFKKTIASFFDHQDRWTINDWEMLANHLHEAGIAFSDLSETHRQSFVSSIDEHASQHTGTGLSVLGKFGITWPAIALSTRKLIWNSFEEAIELTVGIDKGQWLNSFGDLHLDPRQLSDGRRRAVFKAAKQCFGEDAMQSNELLACEQVRPTINC